MRIFKPHGRGHISESRGRSPRCAAFTDKSDPGGALRLSTLEIGQFIHMHGRRRATRNANARRGLQHRLTGGRARLKMRMCLMAKCPRLRMRPRKAWGRKPTVCIRAALVHPNGCDGLHTVSLSFVRGPVTRLYVT